MPPNDLTYSYVDSETGEQVSGVRRTTNPLRITARIGLDVMPVFHGPAGFSFAVGGSLEYRFDMSIFKDYPVFMASLDFGPCVAARMGLPGEAFIGATVGVPVVSLLNAPPFTGTSGLIIENIYANPLAVVLDHRLAWLADRPLVRATLEAGLPLAMGLVAELNAQIEWFSLAGARRWEAINGRTSLALAYAF